MKLNYLLPILLFSSANSFAEHTHSTKDHSSRLAHIAKQLFPEYSCVKDNNDGANTVISLTRLESHNIAQLPENVTVRVVESEELNALSVPNENGRSSVIILSSQFFQRDIADSELALVFAHEFSHLVLGHQFESFDGFILSPRQLARIQALHHQWEERADSLAVTRLQSAGYSVAEAAQLWDRFCPVSRSHLELHPEASKRKLAMIKEEQASQERVL